MEQYIKGFKGFTPVKMCGLSPLASFYLNKSDGNARRKIKIKPLRETNVGAIRT